MNFNRIASSSLLERRAGLSGSGGISLGRRPRPLPWDGVLVRQAQGVELLLKHGLATLVAVSWAEIGIRLLLDRRTAI